VAHGNSLQDGNFVPNLHRISLWSARRSSTLANHVFPSGHEPLIDDFGGIVSPGVYVHTLFDNRVAACTQRLACLVPTWLYLCLCLRRLCARGAVRSHCRHGPVYVSSSSAKRTTKWFVVVRLDLGEVIERCSGSEP
jgi:hypothetical protein